MSKGNVRYTRPPSNGNSLYEKHQGPFHQEHPMDYTEEPDTVVVKTVDVMKIDEPVRVSVVDMPRSADRVVSFGGSQILVPAGKTVAIRRDNNRVAIRLINTHATDTIMVSEKDSSINAKNGFPLLALKELPMTHTREIYLGNPGLNDITVGVLNEYVTELVK